MSVEIQPHATAQSYHYTRALLLLIKMSPIWLFCNLWSVSDLAAFDHLRRSEEVANTFLQNSLIIEEDIINEDSFMGTRFAAAIAHAPSTFKTSSKPSFHGVELAATKALGYCVS